MTIFSGREHGTGGSSPIGDSFWQRCGRRLCACCSPATYRFRAADAVSEQSERAVLTASNLSVQLCAAARSIRGPHRPTNQDRCYSNPGQGLFVLADGMGGRRGGAEASQLIVDRLPWHIMTALPRESSDAVAVRGAIEHACQAVEHEMRCYALRHQDCHSMGTTLAMALILDHTLYVGHAGDCRVYLFRDQQLQQLTHDHNLAQSLVDARLITPDEAARHPWRHRVTNWIGAKPSHQPPDVAAWDLQAGDRLILTSDGLTSAVKHAELEAILRSRPTAHEATRQLVQLAVKNQSRDNISCIVVDFLDCPVPSRQHVQSEPTRGLYLSKPVGVSPRQMLLG